MSGSWSSRVFVQSLGPRVLENNEHISSKTDLIIIGDNDEYKVHRIVILCLSPYFQTVLRFKPIKDGYQTLLLKDISHNILIAIINYAYNGKIDISNDNVEKLLKIADKYNLIGIMKLCAEFLWKRINTCNSIETYLLAHYYNCEELKIAVGYYILQNKLIDQNEELSNHDLSIEMILDLWHKYKEE